MTTRYLGEGETAAIAATLYDGEGASRVAADLGGLTLGLVIQDRAGAEVDVTGKTSVVSAADGSVQFAPDAGDLLADHSPYTATWTVTDGNGDVKWYPQRKPETWIVRR